MRFTADEVAFLHYLNVRCHNGSGSERRWAREQRRQWLDRAIERGVSWRDLEALCDASEFRIRAWLAREGPSDPDLLMSIDPALPRRHLPKNPERSLESTGSHREVEVGRPWSRGARIEVRFPSAESGRELVTLPRSQPTRNGRPVSIRLLTGSDSHGNRLTAEVTRVRLLFEVAGRRVDEKSNVTPDEVSRCHDVAILHFAFHMDNAAVELANPDDPSAPIQVWASDVVAALKAKTPGPGLLVLAGCYSIAIARELGGWSSATIAWRETVNDAEVARYSCGLYVALLRGENLGDAHAAGLRSLGATPEERRPVCAGNTFWSLT